MHFDWDENKRAVNIGKHGVDFAAVGEFAFERATVWDHALHGEPRLVALGPIGGRLHVLVCSVETRAVRVISLRRANQREINRHAAS